MNTQKTSSEVATELAGCEKRGEGCFTHDLDNWPCDVQESFMLVIDKAIDEAYSTGYDEGYREGSKYY